MCNFWSAIITKDMKVLWDKDTKSHEELIKKNGLKDDKLENRDFVKIEITPNSKAFGSMKKSDWTYKVDEEGTLPKWYSANKKHSEAVVWKEWENAMRQTYMKLNWAAFKEFLAHIPKIPYFSMKGEIKKEWHMSFGKTWNAAWDAAGDAVGILVNWKFEAKHVAHLKARMEVWEAGYGLRCDVNGKLFAYGVKK